MGNLSTTSVANDQCVTAKEDGFLSRTIRKRYRIAMMLVLVLWPLVGFWSKLESILVNGMLLDTYRQLGFVAFINGLAFFFGVAIQRLLNSRLPNCWWTKLFGDGSSPWGLSRICWTLLAAAVTPAILAFFFGSEFPFSGLDHA